MNLGKTRIPSVIQRRTCHRRLELEPLEVRCLLSGDGAHAWLVDNPAEPVPSDLVRQSRELTNDQVGRTFAALRPLGDEQAVIQSASVTGAGIDRGPIRTTSTKWVDVPDMSTAVTLNETSNLSITFGANMRVTGGRRIFLRAVVGGHASEPGDVVYTGLDSLLEVKSFTFIKTNVPAGTHAVTVQWYVDPGGTAEVQDSSLVVSSAPTEGHIASIVGRGIDRGARRTTSQSWTIVPDMTTTLTLAETSNLSMTFGANMRVTGGKRIFFRPVVDGQASEPGDVVYTGRDSLLEVKSFTFIQKNVAPGTHTVTMQWFVDQGGTAEVQDSSLVVSAAPVEGHEMTIAGLGVDRGARQTTSRSWVDVPDMTTVVRATEASNLSITFGANMRVTGGKRIFIRPVVDGQVAEPTGVVYTGRDDLLEVKSFTFIKKDVSPGIHTVKMQWFVDQGGTAEVQDSSLVVSAAPSVVPDGLRTARLRQGPANLLTILWDPHRPDHAAPNRDDVFDLLYGTGNSVRDYFLENSQGEFTLQNAAFLGWYDSLKPANHYWQHPADANDGWQGGHSEKWAEAIRLADKDFDYSRYDTNGDEVVTRDELGILMVIPQNSPFGTNRPVVGRQLPTELPLVVDGVRIPWIAEAYIGAPMNMGVVAHELSHLFLNTDDMYFNFYQPLASGPYSLMDQHWNSPHLDPAHKMRLGWLKPNVLLSGGAVELSDVESTGEVAILADPQNRPGEYFILENRWRSQQNYDRRLPASGIAIWHVIDDSNIYQNLPAPPGVDAEKWRDSAKNWGRRGIRMIRPVEGPPFNKTLPLWSADTPQTGRDVRLQWADGTLSPFTVQGFSQSGQTMRFYVDKSIPVAFQESDGRVIVQAEDFVHSVGDPSTGQQWKVISNNTDTEGTPRFKNSLGDGYIQVLHDGGDAPIDVPTDGTPPFVEYPVRIDTPGVYRMYMRWDGFSAQSDSFYVSIPQLRDGPGRQADWYRFAWNGNDYDFETNQAWHGNAGFELTNAGGGDVPAVWNIRAPGVYTIRVDMREDGAAIDAFIFQLDGPPRTSETVFPVRGGQAIIQAEEYVRGFADPASGQRWKIVKGPTDTEGTPWFTNSRGSGYIQALRDAGDAPVDRPVDATPPYVEYPVRFETPGMYQISMRWDGFSGQSDSFYVSIPQLHDGPGKQADWYRFAWNGNDHDFETNQAWHSTAGFESTNAGGGDVPAVWSIPAAGVYTIRIDMREDGAAVDSFRLDRIDPGDSNFDGVVDSADIMQILQRGKFDTGEAADWADGDWNGDGVFNRFDIVAVLQAGNYIQGPRVEKPDLALSNIIPTPTPLNRNEQGLYPLYTLGQTYEFRPVVRNSGTVPVNGPIEVGLTYRGTTFFVSGSGMLQPGEELTLDPFVITETDEGTFEAEFRLDPNGIHDETDESDQSNLWPTHLEFARN